MSLIGVTLPCIIHIPRKPVTLKDFHEGCRPPPLRRLAFGGCVGRRVMSRQNDSYFKGESLKESFLTVGDGIVRFFSPLFAYGITAGKKVPGLGLMDKMFC